MGTWDKAGKDTGRKGQYEPMYAGVSDGVGDAGRRGGKKEHDRSSREWRELLKSARPLKFSPAVNYPKKEISGRFEALLSATLFFLLDDPLPPCLTPSPAASAMDRSSRACFSRVKTLPTGERGRGSEIKN